MVEVKLNCDSDYKYLVDGQEERIKSRYKFLYYFMTDYIKKRELEDKINIKPNILDHVIVDYFVDIDRLKPFQEIEYVNEIKIYSYLSYWILRHKPLQVYQDIEDAELVFVNEDLVTELLGSFLFSEPENIPILDEKQEDVYEFLKTMKYYFCYRSFTAQSVELLLLAFQAGRGYQYSVDYMK